MTIQVTYLCIIDLGIVDLGITVVKRKIITIPGGVASLDNTTISTVDVDNLNIYNKTIHSKTKLNILLKEISN